MSEEVCLRKMTRREFRERMSSDELKLCVLPLAAIEQHLEHLAMEHDWRSVCEVAKRVAEKLSPQVLVAEALMVGISEHHMKHPGTLTLRPGTFMSVLNDLIRSVIEAGFENVLVLNGHGGNVAPIRGVWDQYLREFSPVNLHFMSYWDVYDKADAQELLESGSRLPEDLPGHAQEFETSVGLAAFAENVRTEIWKEQEDQSPSLASAEKGQELLDRAVERVSEVAQAMIDGVQKTETPPYHP